MFFLHRYVCVHLYCIYFCHIHKHTHVDTHESTYPFPQARKIHDLQALFLKHISQFFGYAAVLKMSSPKAPLLSRLSRGTAMWVPKGSSTSRPISCATPSLARRTPVEEKLYFAIVASVFILLREGVCLQTYHSTVTRCKSTCSNLCGLWQILVFRIWRAACTKGTPTNRAPWH